MTFLRRCLLTLCLLAPAPALSASDPDWLYRGSDIARDPAWRFGTLPNGLRYAVRRNAFPAGQVSVRVRIDAGSLNERDEERGWAHFIEHMAFRGTKSYADGEARQTWQKLGASFGSDTNATTTPTQTVYQLDLPKNDEASLDAGIDLLAEMVDSAKFDPAIVDAERKVVMAEKGRMPELSVRMVETSWPLIYKGLLLADRLPIGTEQTLAAATPQGLRALYERWYRPDKATVVLVGDADPALLERMIVKHFGPWQAEGPAPEEPPYGTPQEADPRVAALAYPGAPYNVSVSWIRPYVREPNTIAREEIDFAEELAQRIINRRLEAKARGEASFVGAGFGQSRSPHIADMTQLSITAKEGKWREALVEVFAILGDALRAPPSQAELDRELRNRRIGAAAAVDGESTIRSNQRAQQLIGAVDGDTIVATAATALELIDRFAPKMTPERVGEAMKRLFEGSGPRMVLLAPEPVDQPTLLAALEAAKSAAPAERRADRTVSFDDLPKLGQPGREVSRERIADLDATIVRFQNGSALVFKQTEFDKGQVAVQVRFGSGMAGIDPAQPAYHWLSGIVGPSGIADLDLEGMEQLLIGRRIGMSFGVDEDSFTLSGITNRVDLSDQLRLFTTKLAYPRWDAQLLARSKSSLLDGYDLAFSSATARAGREAVGFTRGDDPRWRPIEKDTIAAVNLDAVSGFFTPRLGEGPIEGIIVGDVDMEAAIAAFARTIGSLPSRRAAVTPPKSLDVRTPAPSPTPRTFTHKGDRNQAYALIGWTTFGGLNKIKERRALSLAANILQVRLFERLREREGASYSPGAGLSFSETFPTWGMFQASAEIRPESADTFFRIAREAVAELAAQPVAADEFERAKNPALSGIERRLKTNFYWLDAMEGWSRDPRLIEATRSYVSDYKGMTADDVRLAVATYIADAGDWSMLVLPAKAEGGAD